MAVAIRKSGFNNIKIYNGGINDWMKSGLPLNSIKKIPDNPVNYIEPEDLHKLIMESDATNCLDKQGNPIFSFIDIRDTSLDHVHKADKLTIKTKCKIHSFIIDDIMVAEKKILPEGKWIVFCETGGRGHFLSRYIYESGKKDILILKSGFLNWEKKEFPTDKKYK
jgi:rhodanese-related sulfurtransferase